MLDNPGRGVCFKQTFDVYRTAARSLQEKNVSDKVCQLKFFLSVSSKAL